MSREPVVREKKKVKPEREKKTKRGCEQKKKEDHPR